jgi:RNA polymerase subunit RPABC4/transcription elongation factor Spt4
MKEKEKAQEERRRQYSVVTNEPEEDQPDQVIVETQDLQGSVVCPECGTNGPGTITSEIPITVYVIVTILIMVVGKWAFFIAPFLFLLINSQIRTCNHCGHIIEQKTQFSVKSVNEQVYTMKFSGDLVIVISKRYAMIIGSIIILLALSIFTYEEFFAAPSASSGNLG